MEPATPSSRSCLKLTAGWALLGGGACATTFAISTIPAPLPDGRQISLILGALEVLLAIVMVPLCALIPIPLLVAGRRYLSRSAHATRQRIAAWSLVASACVAVEALFLFRLVHLLCEAGTGLANLPHPSWHAFAFSIGFLAVGASMTYVLIGARKSAAS